MTIAQQIAFALDDDGTRFLTDDDISLTELSAAAEVSWRDGWRTGDTYRYDYPDGSAIVVSGAAWDFPLSADPRCFCWEGAGEHQEGCPLAHDSVEEPAR